MPLYFIICRGEPDWGPEQWGEYLREREMDLVSFSLGEGHGVPEEVFIRPINDWTAELYYYTPEDPPSDGIEAVSPHNHEGLGGPLPNPSDEDEEDECR